MNDASREARRFVGVHLPHTGSDWLESIGKKRLGGIAGIRKICLLEMSGAQVGCHKIASILNWLVSSQPLPNRLDSNLPSLNALQPVEPPINPPRLSWPSLSWSSLGSRAINLHGLNEPWLDAPNLHRLPLNGLKANKRSVDWIAKTVAHLQRTH